MRYRTVGSFALALAMGIASVTTAISAEVLKVSTFVPPNHAYNRLLAKWSDELKEKSGGELSFEIFPAGQLGPPQRQFELVTAGAADMAVILHGATPGRFPMSELAGLPLSYPSAGQESRTTSRRLTELAQEYLAEEHAGTKIMWMAVTPPLMVHTKSTKPDSVEALKGMRIRYAGAIWQKMIEALDASPLPVPPAESGDALAKGTVDAVTFPFEAAAAYDLAPLLDYSMLPGLASATFSVVLSEETYNRLSPELQKLIDETSGPALGEAFGALWDESEAAARQYMIDGGVELVQLSAEEEAKLKAAVRPVIEATLQAVEDTGKPARAFYEAYTQ